MVMGKGKVGMVKPEPADERLVSFNRRQKGLSIKAADLCMFCNANKQIFTFADLSHHNLFHAFLLSTTFASAPAQEPPVLLLDEIKALESQLYALPSFMKNKNKIKSSRREEEEEKEEVCWAYFEELEKHCEELKGVVERVESLIEKGRRKLNNNKKKKKKYLHLNLDLSLAPPFSARNCSDGDDADYEYNRERKIDGGSISMIDGDNIQVVGFDIDEEEILCNLFSD